ncbi:OmpW/AlkL family protein [Chromobacterium subtsugae]|uniref:OmpW/AlkL family protein n=1 Tax=Chromobacterium subtsugae TaxID=251747 RepID=UPI000640BCDC|nr:OmpW family outer membrane protein [Chromobacterium subtsugae]
MKKLALAAAIGMISASAFAAQGDILARFRVIDVDPSASWSNGAAGTNVDAKSSAAPELDFTYMITNNIGAELILGTSRHKITNNGVDIGKVSVLPPTVTVQYHFAPEATFRPYVGAGLNYTRFYNDGLANGAITVKKNSFGPALQAGADIAINKSWFVNFDVKKLWVQTDVSAGNVKLGTLHVDPWVFGVGVGTKF